MANKETNPNTKEKKIDNFIARWKASGGNEMSNFQPFLLELTDLLEVEAPKPAMEDGNNDDYRFERPVKGRHTPTQEIGKEKKGRIDLYRKGCFVMEGKQGSNQQDGKTRQKGHGKRGTKQFDASLLKAFHQADRYCRSVSSEDGWPPFLIIVDVGNTIDLYADFSRHGQGYTQFPNGKRYRMRLDDLTKAETRELLATIWNDPFSLDPSLQAAKVTREIASHLAELGKSFENQGHASEAVSKFLMRCLFSMFAEDVELIPKRSFTSLLKELRETPDTAAPMLEALWTTMNTGGFSPALRQDLMKFNGGLFAESHALPLNTEQIDLLIEAGESDWQQVEPAIFGTLLERALDKRQRHKLGAHYTPRAYVERLVTPTIMEPLREDWKNVRASAAAEAEQGNDEQARELVHAFHRKLCKTRVLDPACGSGNFLYVAMEMMKRLEGEVTSFLEDLGEQKIALSMESFTVDPSQFLGIEINPWAAGVAELVLWIGYLQWHFKTYGKATPAEPVLRDFKNIECRDAILDWDDRILKRDENGELVTRWDGITTKTHPVTGEEVPNPEARIEVYDYVNPRAAEWPEAEFIVGNPPFIGNKRMREALGVGYVDAVRKAFSKLPNNIDFVMYWWFKSGQNLQDRKLKNRLGLITTNSLSMESNRKILENFLSARKKRLSLVFAIDDHPWIDTTLAASVRISMTVAKLGNSQGLLLSTLSEQNMKSKSDGKTISFASKSGTIFPDLRIGSNVAEAKPLQANSNLAFMGIIRVGEAFVVSTEEEPNWSQLAKAGHLPQYMNGQEMVNGRTNRKIIDLTGLTSETVKEQFPRVYQRLKNSVKVEREAKAANSKDYSEYARLWWLFAKPRPELRKAKAGLSRIIATVETTKHRCFGFLEAKIVPDQKLRIVASNDAALLAMLSSKQHLLWSLASGGLLGPTPVYSNGKCFDPFPFPDPAPEIHKKLDLLGEQLDAHRKARQAEHPKLTLTQMYNVLEKLRTETPLDEKDKAIYDQGLIGILKQIHDDIDEAVAQAYGWPADLTDEEVLYRLVDLNKERVAEEAQGKIRWLRPEYQNPDGKEAAKPGEQTTLDMDEKPLPLAVDKWPKDLPEQFAAVRAALEEIGEASPTEMGARFKGAGPKKAGDVLQSLASLGLAERLDDGRFVRV